MVESGKKYLFMLQVIDIFDAIIYTEIAQTKVKNSTTNQFSKFYLDNKSENTGELNPEKEEFVGNFIKTAEIFEEINGDKFAGISYTENDEIFQNDGDSSENFF